MDDLATIARRHGKALHGHTLLWHRSVPDWFVARLRDAPEWSLIHHLFASTIPRYGDLIRRWDVVNEPIAPPEEPQTLRASPFQQAFGDDYVRRALETARLFAPKGGLMINEYGLEHDDPGDNRRRQRLLRLVDNLRRVGAPLDGIGLQSHLDLRKGRLRQDVVARFLADLAARGLWVVITELDVKEDDYTLPVERRDEAVASEVRSFLDVALASPAVRGVTTWGLSDRTSWLDVTDADRARWPRAWTDGSTPGVNRGLPLDAGLMRKPMREAILKAFIAAGKSTPQPLI